MLLLIISCFDFMFHLFWFKCILFIEILRSLKISGILPPRTQSNQLWKRQETLPGLSCVWLHVAKGLIGFSESNQLAKRAPTSPYDWRIIERLPKGRETLNRVSRSGAPELINRIHHETEDKYQRRSQGCWNHLFDFSIYLASRESIGFRGIKPPLPLFLRPQYFKEQIVFRVLLMPLCLYAFVIIFFSPHLCGFSCGALMFSAQTYN